VRFDHDLVTAFARGWIPREIHRFEQGQIPRRSRRITQTAAR
jgi:hypothetical protein